MRHQVDGRKFGRNTSHRVAMLKNLANSVIQQEQIVTTVQKAKEARRVVDRLITLAKRGTPASRRLAFDRTRDNAVVAKLFGTLKERYSARAGGYTRVLKLADRRWGDAAEMAILELVDHPPIDRKRKVKTEAETTEATKKAESTQAQADPFSKMRKTFGGGRSKVSGATGKGAGRSKSAAGRKTPSAGGGGSKSGGSSS